MPFMALLCLRKTGGTSPKTHVRYSVEMFTGGLVYTHSLKKKKKLVCALSSPFIIAPETW